jgi:AhpD family alkylhydroperoxidase
VTEPAPRIPPIPPGTVPDDVRVALKGWLKADAQEVIKPLDTLARHPDLAKGFLAFNRHLLYESTLPPRTRELLILRTAAICGNTFERVAHERMARREGIDDETIARTALGPDAAGWTNEDAALMRATDELLSDWKVSDTTWQQLAAALDEHQLMDAVFTVGAYALLAMGFNSFGVAPDEES